jgi:predicted amidohydrolase
LPHITLAPLICYDQWFPEPARIHALQGTQLLIYPTAIGWIDQMIQEEPFSAQRWEDSMRAHASMNGIYVAAINRVGKEQMYDPKSNKNLSIQFWGNSFIADPYGQVIAKASSTDEQFITGSIDLEKITACQEGWGFLRNRRPDSYSKLLE